ncbi:MAG: S41 family peptidase, partial [Alistipes sp.]
DMSNFELMTTGKYGGIGSLIRKKGDYITIAQPYKGTPADLAGLKIGDKIIAIDGKEAKGFSIEEVSKRLKGDPNTIVKLTVERLIGGARETFSLKRERIAIPGIPYAGFVADGIGYVQHSDFTEGCYEDMRARIEQLRAQGNLKGLILDYRNNGGGILQEAVKILSMFVPKGTEVVVTKGRKDSTVFRTAAEPILPNLPLVVLVNGNTASAAEIVSGALQDLDRAVLIGQKSFGKGLVQTTRPLGYNAFLKLTTAKYYMPSGRCIQAIDYSLHNPNGAVKEVPDSLIREFATKGGRKVYDGGGIMPDLKIEPEYISRFAM